MDIFFRDDVLSAIASAASRQQCSRFEGGAAPQGPPRPVADRTPVAGGHESGHPRDVILTLHNPLRRGPSRKGGASGGGRGGKARIGL